MAKILDLYKERYEEFCSQISKDSFIIGDLPELQELNYRICVIETFRLLCKSAPVTSDIRIIGYHFQLLDAQIRFIVTERKFGAKTDEDGKKKQETAHASLENVIHEGKKWFTSFLPETKEQYKEAVGQYVNTVLPVWMQYRNTYININI